MYRDAALRKFSTTAGVADFHDAMHGTFPRGEFADTRLREKVIRWLGRPLWTMSG